MRRLSLCVAVLLSGGQTAAAIAQEASVTLPAPLLEVLTAYENAWRDRGDGSRLAALFVEDGFALPPGMPPVRGRAAIQKLHGGRPGSPLALRAIAYGVEGNHAYVIGGFARNRGEPDGGKFVLVLRKESDGKWRIVSDIENNNARPQ